MIEAGVEEAPLTDEQRRIAELPVHAMALVVAGPGAGKTHTLVQRIVSLADDPSLDDGTILVLSFSRATVRDLRQRLIRHGCTAGRAKAQTFDSWALELLLAIEPKESWQDSDFDTRIQAATELIGGDEANARYEDLRHVVVDEVQDLVGDRQDMVYRLLATYDCGFTAVGDPAQAIYNFQVEKGGGPTGPGFADQLRDTFKDELLEFRLTRNFRAQTTEARSALSIGPRLQTGERTDETIHSELRSLLQSTLMFGDLRDENHLAGLAGYEGTTAILSRNNAQALQISQQLYRAGISHRLRRSARDRLVPAWVARLYSGTTTSVVSRTEFDELLAAGSQGIAPEMLWSHLLRAVGSPSPSLDLSRLRSLLAHGRLPDELTAEPSARLVVSSIHRAKGLEFDRVIVEDPGPIRKGVDSIDEARILYVAMTRQRLELMWSEPSNTLPQYDQRIHLTKRWGRYDVRKRGRRYGIEIFGGDVETVEPPGLHQNIPRHGFLHNAVDIQAYLRDKVTPGNELQLDRVEEVPAPEMAPRYLIRHGDNRMAIGVTNSRFGSELFQYMKRYRTATNIQWPRTISAIRVDEVETVVGSTAAGARAGLGDRGVWLAPRLVGMGRFTYDKFQGGKHDG